MPHASPITCIDHHASTGAHATGGYDGRVVSWFADGSESWAADFDDLVNDVRFDAEGRRLAVAVADGRAYILDARSGAVVRTFGPHDDDVNAVRWSPDGRAVACVMDHGDTSVRIWRVADPDRPPQQLVGHDSGVFAAAFDSSGGRLATAAEDGTARIWDLASATVTRVLRHPGDPESLDWSPDDRFVVTGCDDGVVRVWDPSTGDLLRELADAGAAARFVRFDPTGSRVMIGAYDAAIRIYDVDTWSVVETLRAPFQWERSGAFANGGVLVGSFGAKPIDHRDRAAPPPLTYGVNALACVGRRIVAGRDDGTVIDVIERRVLARHCSIVNSVVASQDGDTLASADYGSRICISTVGDGRSASHAVEGGPVNSLVWQPDGDLLYSGSYDGCVRVWHVEGSTLVPVGSFRAAHGPIKSIAWCAFAGLLLVGSSDGSVSGWRDQRQVWRERRDDMVLVNGVACAEAAGVAVSVSRDRTVRLWDAAYGGLVEVLPTVHQKSVKAVAVNADASLIVTGSYDGTAVAGRRTMSGEWSFAILGVHGKPGVPAVMLANGGIITAGWSGTIAEWSEGGRLRSVYDPGELT